MSYTDPYVTLQKNTNSIQAEIMVGKSTDDMPASLIDRQVYGLTDANGNIIPSTARKEFTIQSWKDIDQKGGIHIRQAKNTSILPYGNVFQPIGNVTTGAGALTNAQTIRWAVDSFESVIEHVYVELNFIFNATAGNNITLAPFVSWFDGIRLYFNDNDGQSINMDGGVEYRAYGMERQDEERVILAPRTNTDATTFNGITCTGAGSPQNFTYRFRLPGFWEVVPWPMRTVQRFNLLLTLPAGSAYTTSTLGTGSLSNINVTSWNLVFDPRVISPMVYSKLSEAWFEGISIKYMEFLQETYLIPIPIAPATTPINLNNIQGLTPQLNVILRDSTLTGATRVITYDEVSAILIQDSSGVALLGQQNMATNFLNTHAIIENGLFSLMPSTATKVYYPILFGEGGFVAWKRNFMRIQGYQSLLRNRFILTSGPTASGASRNVTFECYRMIFLKFDRAGNSGMMNMTVIRF